MKKRLVPIACLTALSAFLLPLPSKAQTVAPCDASSYVVLPGGQCVDLSYLEILGASRANFQQIDSIYQQQFDTNLELEILYDQYPQYVSETEEEREERYRSLAQTSLVRDEIAANHEGVERALFPLQVRTLAIMREAFSP